VRVRERERERVMMRVLSRMDEYLIGSGRTDGWMGWSKMNIVYKKEVEISILEFQEK
jgi:hypothetical protein